MPTNDDLNIGGTPEPGGEQVDPAALQAQLAEMQEQLKNERAERDALEALMLQEALMGQSLGKQQPAFAKPEPSTTKPETDTPKPSKEPAGKEAPAGEQTVAQLKSEIEALKAIATQLYTESQQRKIREAAPDATDMLTKHGKEIKAAVERFNMEPSEAMDFVMGKALLAEKRAALKTLAAKGGEMGALPVTDGGTPVVELTARERASGATGSEIAALIAKKGGLRKALGLGE